VSDELISRQSRNYIKSTKTVSFFSAFRITAQFYEFSSVPPSDRGRKEPNVVMFKYKIGWNLEILLEHFIPYPSKFTARNHSTLHNLYI